MPQGFFFYVGVAIKKDYNIGLLPGAYLEDRLSSLIQVEDMEWDFIRNNQNEIQVEDMEWDFIRNFVISQNLNILAF